MDDVESMLRYIEHDPDNLTAVCGLTDLLMQERDMNRSEADRFAERAVQAVRDARDLARAAELLQKEQPWYAELVRDIVFRCGLTADTEAQIVLAPGEAEPRFHNTRYDSPGAWWSETTVTVGARWVVMYWRANPSLCLMAKPRKRRPSRSR